MKNKIFYLAAMFLGLGLAVTFITCEKDNDVQPQLTVQEPMLIPTEFSDYVTPEDVKEVYKEVEREGTNLSYNDWEMIPLSINMRNTVTYENNNGMTDFQNPTTVLFEGTGNWDEFGEISYSERIPYPLTFTRDWKGTGSMILLKPKATVPPAHELEFRSGFRTKTGIATSDRMSAPSEVIESVIEFTDGRGVFNEPYGKAIKVEMYFGDRSYCNTYIYGSVWTRKGAVAITQTPPPVKM